MTRWADSFFLWVHRAHLLTWLVGAAIVGLPVAIPLFLSGVTLETYLVSAGALLVILVWILWRAFRAGKRTGRATKNLFFAFEKFDRLDEAIRVLERNINPQTNENLDAAFEAVKFNLTDFLGEICKIYDDYTSFPCHVSVKIFKYENRVKSDRVITYGRDRCHSQHQRWQTDIDLPEFSYNKSTQFKKIVDSSEERYFVNNNLKRLGRQYENRNENWHSYYNATLVVPISEKFNRSSLTKDSIEGFLCIDNKYGGFDQRISVNIALAFARVLYRVIMRTRQLEIVKENRNANHR